MDEVGAADRPSVVVDGEEVLYRASSLGSCTRALAAARQELERWTGPTPAKIQQVFDRGHEAEARGIQWFRNRGWTVDGEQRKVTVRLTGKLSIVGHVDCIVGNAEKDITPTIMDVKSQSDEEFAKESIRDSVFWPKYEWQFSSYSVGLGMPIGVLRINGDNVKLEYLDGLRTKSDLLGRVLYVERLAAQDLRNVECDRDDFPCPFWNTLHPTREEYVEVMDENLANLALHYTRLGVEIQPLEDRRKEIRAALIKMVGGDDKQGRVREVDSGILIRVTTSTVKEKLIPAGQSTRLSVKLPSEGERDNDRKSNNEAVDPVAGQG